jgi:hypothetical protein
MSRFHYKAYQYIEFAGAWQCSPLIVECVQLKIVCAPLTLIFRMGKWPCHYHFWLQRRPLPLLQRDMTTQPFDCQMCKTKNGWCSVHNHIEHSETAFVHSSIGCKESYTRDWHSILRFYLLLFATWRFVASAFLINLYARYVSEGWCGPITFLRFQPGISAM